MTFREASTSSTIPRRWDASLRGAVAAALLWTGNASASTVEECVASADRGQVLRDEGQLVSSRTALLACANDACPSMVRRDCLAWLEALDARLPTVILAVKTETGADVVDAEILVDGRPSTEAAAGRAIPLDPGPHTFEARRGRAKVSQRVVIREREKDRSFVLVLEQEGPRVDATPVPKRSVPTITWVLAGVAVGGGATFAYFWPTGVDELHTLRETCAPSCTDEQVSSMQTSLTVGRIGLGVGIAAAAAAITTYLLMSPSPRKDAIAPIGVVRF